MYKDDRLEGSDGPRPLSSIMAFCRDSNYVDSLTESDKAYIKKCRAEAKAKRIKMSTHYAIIKAKVESIDY